MLLISGGHRTRFSIIIFVFISILLNGFRLILFIFVFLCSPTHICLTIYKTQKAIYESPKPQMYTNGEFKKCSSQHVNWRYWPNYWLQKSVLKAPKFIELPQNVLQIQTSSGTAWSKVLFLHFRIYVFKSEHSNFYFDRWWEFSQFTHR